MSLFTMPYWLSMLSNSAAPATLVTMMSCAQPASPPKVIMTFTPSQPSVTHNLDHNALGQFATSTTFSHHKNEVFLTGGITESNIRTEFSAGFTQQINPMTGQACLAVNEINLNLIYEPVVHIASNFPQGSCRFMTTWEHELRHVNTDLVTLKERAPLLEQAAKDAAMKISVIGPMERSALEVQQQAVIDQIGAVINTTFVGIDQLRMQRQQLIDTRAEYLRLSKACPPDAR